MLKKTLEDCWRSLCELGNPPANMRPSKNHAYRSGFQRSIGAIFFLFVYFAFASRKLTGVKASSNNNGIYILLFFGVIVAGLGAFFAPRIAAHLYFHSLSGRRYRASKAIKASKMSRKSKMSSHQDRKSSSSQSEQTKVTDNNTDTARQSTFDSRAD